MKKYLILYMILLLIIGLSNQILCKNVAILVMDGKFDNCNYTLPSISTTSSYWVKLLEIYERLIEHGYTHDNIYVFYGDGQDYNGDQLPSMYIINTSSNGQQSDWPNITGWEGQITDFPVQTGNYLYNTIRDYIKDNISSNDNLLIIWHSHGGSRIDNDHWQSQGTSALTEVQVYNAFNQIQNYQRRIIFWESCYSGSLVKGELTFLNNGVENDPDDPKTIVITACDDNEEGCLYRDNLDLWEGNNHYGPITQGGLVYGLLCALNSKDVYGIESTVRPGQNLEHFYNEQGEIINSSEQEGQGRRVYVDENNDGVINLSELYNALYDEIIPNAKDDDYDAYYTMSWDRCGNGDIKTTYPQLAFKNGCSEILEYLYFDEYLIMDGDRIRSGEGVDGPVWKGNYRAGSIELKNEIILEINSEINLVADKKNIIQTRFPCKTGCKSPCEIWKDNSLLD